MTNLLAAVATSGSPLPPRVIVFGDPGTGKSTCAAKAFNPVVIQTEDGMGTNEVPCFPVANSFAEIRSAVRELAESDHQFTTLVIDSIDGAEKLIEREVCEENGKESMGDFAYYKGNVFSLDKMTKFLHDLDALRRTKKMQIILISHAARVTVEDPVNGTFDRMEPNLYRKTVPLVVAWADIVAFMAHERATIDKGDRDSNRTIRTTRTTGSRLLHFRDEGSFLAKNRRGLPGNLEVTEDAGWSIVEKAISEAAKKKKAKTQKAKAKKEAA